MRNIDRKNGVLYVQLKHGILMLDEQDEHFLNEYSWVSMLSDYTAYAKANKGRFTLRLHRLIMAALPFQEVDHRDRNGLNNRRENLRISDRHLNMLNRRLFKSNKSGFRGVSFDRIAGMWQAHIKHLNRQINLGRFSTPEAAAKRFDEEARRLRGDDAQTNFPNPKEPPCHAKPS